MTLGRRSSCRNEASEFWWFHVHKAVTECAVHEYKFRQLVCRLPEPPETHRSALHEG